MKEPLIKVKSNEEIKIHFKRMYTQYKIKSMLFVRSLDYSFYLRVLIFGGVVYLVLYQMQSNEEGGGKVRIIDD